MSVLASHFALSLACTHAGTVACAAVVIPSSPVLRTLRLADVDGVLELVPGRPSPAPAASAA